MKIETKRKSNRANHMKTQAHGTLNRRHTSHAPSHILRTKWKILLVSKHKRECYLSQELII